MEEEPRDERERPGYPAGGADPNAGPTWPHAGGTDAPPEVRALADEADEIRRMVDEGAGSPEAIRDLAARLREHRAREEALWRSEVKPALVKENKGRLRGHPRPLRPAVPERPSANLGALALLLVAILVIVLIAASTTAWVLVLALVGLVAYAWREGRKTLQ